MATVKKVAATADAARAEWNAKQTLKTQNAKSGGTARLYSAIASAGKNAEKGMGKKTKIVKKRFGLDAIHRLKNIPLANKIFVDFTRF